MSGKIENIKIGIGVIGTGAISAHHIRSLRELGDCEFVATASSSRQRAEAAQNKYGVKAYSDYHQLLENKDIHAVIICTESGNHMDPAIASAKAGKHILIEKPIEINPDRAQQIISACQENKVKLSCLFQNRFSPDYIKLKQAVTSGLLGSIFMGNAYIHWYRKPDYYNSSQWKGTLSGDGGAALINQGIHTIDLLLDIMGDAACVFGKIKTVTHNIEGEDLGVGLVTFKNGAMGSIHASTAIHPGYPEKLEIFGTNGSVIMEAGKIIHWNIVGESIAADEPGLKPASGSSDPMGIGHLLHKTQIEAFVASIRNNLEPPISGEEALKSLKLITAIYESSRTKNEICFEN